MSDKIYVVYFDWGGHDCYPLGFYSSYEKAQQEITNLVETERRYYPHRREDLSVREHTLDILLEDQ